MAVEVRSANIPDTVYAENELSASFELTELYTKYDEWTLEARSLLELPNGGIGAEWTVETYDSDGNQLDTRSIRGETIEISVGNQAESRIVIQATGIVPFIENHETFDSLLLFEFTEVGPDGTSSTLGSWSAEYKVDGTPTSTPVPDTPTPSSLQTATPTDGPTQTNPPDEKTPEGTITEEEPTQTPVGEAVSSDKAEERQRGFISNKGDEPDFLSNPFNLTTLGFLLSVVGIIHQMMGGE